LVIGTNLFKTPRSLFDPSLAHPLNHPTIQTSPESKVNNSRFVLLSQQTEIKARGKAKRVADRKSQRMTQISGKEGGGRTKSGLPWKWGKRVKGNDGNIENAYEKSKNPNKKYKK